MMKGNPQEQKLNKEGKQPCLWDMQMIIKTQHVLLSMLKHKSGHERQADRLSD